MTDTPHKWSERLIARILTSERGPVPFTRYICVPNVKSGVVRTGESDLIAMSASGYLREYEIKISVQDLKKDLKKLKHKFWENGGHPISELWYALPQEVADKVEVSDYIPAYAGIVTLEITPRGRYTYKVVREATRRKDAKKHSPEEMLKVARLGCIRYWSYSARVGK